MVLSRVAVKLIPSSPPEIGRLFVHLPAFEIAPNFGLGEIVSQQLNESALTNAQTQNQGWIDVLSYQVENFAAFDLPPAAAVNQGIVFKDPILPAINIVPNLPANEKGKGKLQDDAIMYGPPVIISQPTSHVSNGNFEKGNSSKSKQQEAEIVVID
ncbi:hypothetical protein AgCh_015664 [Apium graveolens]